MGNLEKLGILVIVILVVVVGVVAITPKSTVDERLYPEQTAADVTPESLEPVAADGKREDVWPVEPGAQPAPATKPLPGADPFAVAPTTELPTFRTIKVQQNDTLAGIATRELGNAARFKEILDANPGLVASKLKGGMEIKIPVAPATAIAPAPTPGTTTLGAPAPATSGRTYVVKSGDTLSSIAAREMGSTKKWTELAKANEDLLHGSTALKIGMKLQIPTADGGSSAAVASRDPAPSAGPAPAVSGATAEREYVVKSGDSLWAIAKNEMGSESLLKELRAANQDVLKGSDSLRVGMKLRIPAKK
jgi:nucleoid-associated protein YgaU